MVARVGRRPLRMPRRGAAPLIAERPVNENAGEMGWIRTANLPPHRPFCRLPRSYVAAFIFAAGRAALWIASPAVQRLAR